MNLMMTVFIMMLAVVAARRGGRTRNLLCRLRSRVLVLIDF